MRRSLATPCPVSTHLLPNDDFHINEDTTTNFEFTTAFPSTLRNAGPRRPAAAYRAHPNFIIHEDDSTKREVVRGAPTIAAQPPKRSTRWLSSSRQTAPTQIESQKDPQNGLRGCSSAVGSRQPALPPAAAVPAIAAEKKPDVPSHAERNFHRQARRKTLYIPSEDTTQPSMWMGIFSPIKDVGGEPDNTLKQAQLGEGTGIAASMVAKRHRRSSIMSVAAKRVPLQPPRTFRQENHSVNDQPGAPTGKENVPPGSSPQHKSTTTKKVAVRGTKFTCDGRQKPATLHRDSLVLPPNVAPLADTSPKQLVPSSHQPVIDQQRFKAPLSLTTRAEDKDHRPIARTRLLQKPEDPKASSRFVRLSIKQMPCITSQMPLLEDLANTAMYEDNWLVHQEVVMTMLVNELFAKHNSILPPDSDINTRRSLLVKYNSEEMGIMHQRLQAACQHGSLSFTAEGLVYAQGLVSDVGRRKAFIKFWIDNFNNHALRVALEVVLGRQLPVDGARDDLSTSSIASAKRKYLVRVIEAFLVRLDDIPEISIENAERPAKILHRCLMLIKGLDLLKSGERPSFSSRLFRDKAWVKTSPNAVQALVRMLNPSIGDCIRTLNQIGYEVNHSQHPRDEITYKVKNLAVDLRDGTLLTRLVEIMLYTEAISSPTVTNEQSQTTLLLTEGTIVDIVHQDDFPLTRHLKLPCISRASQIWNVEIALESLRKVDSVAPSIQNICPDDIVDGFREKTMQLLWILTAQWGLTALIDLFDVRHEIKRLWRNRITLAPQHDHNVQHSSVQTEAEILLKDWARAVASSRGFEVRNFTTAFSNGVIFASIVDEYCQYLTGHDSDTRQSLHEKLSSVGCSSHFAELFSGDGIGQGHIFSEEFVLAALAYLCNRLLRPSKACRAAIILQRAWRRRLQKVLEFQKRQKSMIARACADAVSKTAAHILDEHSLHSIIPGNGSIAKSKIETDVWLQLSRPES